MPTTIAAIKSMLDANGIHYSDTPRPDEIGMGWESALYVDPDTGRKSVAVFVKLEEEGRLIKVFAPACFRMKDVAHKSAMLEALLGVCWRTKLLQFEFDDSDGEIRAMVEWPVEDGTVTFAQVSRAIRAKSSAPTFEMKVTSAPTRAAATAWLEPLPPGPIQAVTIPPWSAGWAASAISAALRRSGPPVAGANRSATRGRDA